MSQLSDLVSGFVEELSAAIEADVMERVRSNIEASLGTGPRRGRPPAVLAMGAPRARRKAPIQLCPVPGCKNRAAPVFGMVCSEHKNVAKSKINKYREARKEAKAGKTTNRGKLRKAAKTRKMRQARATAKSARSAGKAKPAKRRTAASKRTARGTRRKAPARRPPAAAAAPAAVPVSSPVAAST